MSNVKNTFGHPPSSGASQGANFLNLGRTFWGIDGVPVTATAAQLNAAGSGGFDYENTVYVGTGGNDSNTGNQNEPLATLNAAALSIPSGGIIRILDNSNHAISSTVTITGPTLIDIGGSTLSWSGGAGGNMFHTNANCPLYFYGNKILAAGTAQVFRGLGSVVVNGPAGYCTIIDAFTLWQDDTASPNGVPQAIFNIDTNTGSRFALGYSGQQIINALNLDNFCTITSLLTSGSGTGNSCVVNVENFNGALAGTADYSFKATNLGTGFTAPTSGVVTCDVAKSLIDLRSTSGKFAGYFGYVPVNGGPSGPFLFTYNNFFNPISMVNQPILGELYDVFFTSSGPSFSFSPGSSGNSRDGSNQQIQLPFVNGTIVLPDAVLNSLPAGYRFTAAQSVASGVLVQTSGSDTLSGQNSVGPGATTCYTGIGICEFVVGPSNGAGGVAWIVDNCYTSNLASQLLNVDTYKVTPPLTFTNLAAAAHVNFVTAQSATAQYVVSNILFSGVGGTQFSGVGGDRDLIITDGTNVFCTILAATLQGFTTNAVLGDASGYVPLPTTIPLNQLSVAGAHIYATYANGTTDYTAGSVGINIECELINI
jgi:hypothetical protein